MSFAAEAVRAFIEDQKRLAEEEARELARSGLSEDEFLYRRYCKALGVEPSAEMRSQWDYLGLGLSDEFIEAARKADA